VASRVKNALKGEQRVPVESGQAPPIVDGGGPDGVAVEEPSVDRELIDTYLSTSEVTRLHIGCGQNLLDGWLNSDFSPGITGVIHLDAAQPFPFEDGALDFIYSEHMIEHLPYQEGMVMLSECHRVLRPGGVLRLTTPDLLFLIELYSGDNSQLQDDYIKWATDTFISHAPGYADTFVVNNFFRDWGHQFIYDRKTLQEALERAGFTAINECSIGESSHVDLRGLENETRMPPGFLVLESMVFEASRG
jgi:predicted SAM-dependent methyltransferase